MIERPELRSASGLRPMSAYVVIAAVLALVAANVLGLAIGRRVDRPDLSVRERGAPPAFSIRDAEGRELATSAPRFDLVMSPRSMWQAHTPLYMASRISEALGGEPSPQELLARMLPDARLGVIEVEAWELSLRRAHALNEWIENGAGRGTGPVDGIQVLPHGTSADGAPTYRLYWQPAVLLSRAERGRHGFDGAWSWARHVAHGLAGCLGPALGEGDPVSQVWSALLPRGHCTPMRGLPSERVLALRDLLAEEGVSPWQMRISYASDRVYPSGEHPLLGSWGFLDPDQSEARPREGLELLCARLLEEPGWSFLEPRPETYSFLQDRAVRGQRANAFVGHVPAGAAPAVRTTLDMALMRQVRRRLEGVMEEHRPAVAEAIVVDVASGDVLAVDAVVGYAMQPFAPIAHAFTPGSTFKVLTMAIALEEGQVTPDERFDVGNGEYVLRDPKGGVRIIHEAEGHLTGVQSATWCLAGSMNAGLVQIGLRVPAEVFRGYLEPLGYGSAPETGLGIERAGYLAPLPWSWRNTHASVCFGHEISTTLWQHAGALATVLRGGVWRPLSILHSVEQGDQRFALPQAPERRVFSGRTCAQVREMMELGAREGTGRDLWREDVAMGTKTGTAEKVPDELCLHVELAERERCEAQGVPMTRAWYRGLKSKPQPHRSCYTSSICMYGSLPGSGRELMVVVVVDEPRGKAKFGSKVAGPAAAAILAEALGLTRDGVPFEPELVAGFGVSTVAERNPSDEPWRVLD